jgi:hypothetical protein
MDDFHLAAVVIDEAGLQRSQNSIASTRGSTIVRKTPINPHDDANEG